MKMTFEKSIVSADSIEKDTIIALNMLAYKKPGNGIPARNYKDLIGKRLKNNVNKDYKFKWEDFE